MPDILDIEHVIIFNDANISQEDVIRALGERLIQTGCIEEQYVSEVLEREKHYPTGLEIGEVNAAIPHAVPDFVKQPSIAVGIVKQGVAFRNMADPSQSLDVHVVFLLAMTNPESQLKMLEQTMALIQDKQQLLRLASCEQAEEVIQVFQPSQFLTKGNPR